MRRNGVRKQVLVYAAVVLILAGAAAWLVLSHLSGDQLFEEGERANILLVGHNDAPGIDSLTLLSVSESNIVLFAFPVSVRLQNPFGDFARASDLVLSDGAGVVAAAIGALLGIDIPFTVSFSRDQLEAWVETLEGVVITLDASAIYFNSMGDPAIRMELRPGEQQLDGDGAVAFAISPSEDGDIGLLSRQQLLWRSLISQGIVALDMRSMRRAVRSIAPELETNLSISALVQVAELLHDTPSEDVQAGELAGEIVEIDGLTYTQPNAVETERRVAALLKGLDLLTPKDVKVAVFNGNGERSMAAKTADYLRARGFQVTGIANADTFEYDTSYVIVLSDESKAWVLRDALPSEARIVFPDTFSSHYELLEDYIPAGTDIVLIAGKGLEIE